MPASALVSRAMKRPGTLAESLDYRRLALSGQTLDGELYVWQLPRTLATILSSEDRRISVELRFSEDDQRRVRLAGEATGTLDFRCQRCLEPFETTVSATIAGVLVADDDAAAGVPRGDEPIMAEQDALDVHALIDDEMLLALPQVARCDRPACRSEYKVDESSKSAVEEKKTNPFAALEALKRDEPPQR